MMVQPHDSFRGEINTRCGDLKLGIAYRKLISSRYLRPVNAVEMGVEANSSTPVSVTMLVAARYFVVLAMSVQSSSILKVVHDISRSKHTHRSMQHLRLSILKDQEASQEYHELLQASRRFSDRRRFGSWRTGQAGQDSAQEPMRLLYERTSAQPIFRIISLGISRANFN